MGHLVIVRLFGSERFLKMGELVKMRSFFVLRGCFVHLFRYGPADPPFGNRLCRNSS